MHRVAGSIAPVMDCYRPDLSPGEAARAEHRELVELLAEMGHEVDLSNHDEEEEDNDAAPE